jgi:hypothetical protein
MPLLALRASMRLDPLCGSRIFAFARRPVHRALDERIDAVAALVEGEEGLFEITAVAVLQRADDGSRARIPVTRLNRCGLPQNRKADQDSRPGFWPVSQSDY